MPVQYQSAAPATPPAGTAVATEAIDGQQYQLCKLVFGGPGELFAVDVDSGFPVSIVATPPEWPTSDNQLATIDAIGGTSEPAAASDNAVSGLNGLLRRFLAAIRDRLPAALTGAGNLRVSLQEQAGALAVSVGNTVATTGVVSVSNTVTVSGPLTDAQLRAGAVPVSGNVNVGNTVPVSGPLTDAQLRAGAVPVSGTFWPGTQPVSGPLTDAQLRAGAVPVSGTFWPGTQPVSGPLTDAELRATPVTVTTGGLTDAQLRASAVPVTTGGLTDAQLRATPVPVASALQAGTALAGQVIAAQQTGAIYQGTTALAPKYAKISAAGAGDNTVVAAVAGSKIRVLSYRFQAGGDVDVKFRSGAGGTDLTGAMSAGAKGGGGGAAYSPAGHFESAAGAALVVNLSLSVQVSGHLCYIEAP
jgi:hypothetical protein